MAENYLQEVINGISRAIAAEFPECEIYDTPIRSGLKEPCFRIKCTTPDRAKIRGQLYRYDYAFDIAYFPEDRAEPEYEIRDATERLQDILEIITIRYSDTESKDTWQAYPIDFSVVDDVLHAKVTYKGEYLRTPKTDDGYMQQAEFNREVR